jgi:hypothetical protein
MHKFQQRNIKQQGNRFLSKANSITKDLNNSEDKEISKIEFKKIIVSMINELKE